ncbi:MAG: hypothetical protein SPI35_08135 [Porphyromonas sp.]|nr:hypothetical protein [Porphyromonas sp.]
MANSNFRVFAESVAGTNVMSDAEYATDTQRINGVAPGLAPAALHNKLYKQATIMAAALAQVLVEQGQNALDSDYSALVAALKKSLVLSLNGEKPDENGNIQKKFVFSVDGKKPDGTGNVTLGIDYLNAVSFIGSVMITKDNINPGTKLGGTWQLLQSGRYIRTAGDGYTGGMVGGGDGFTLSVKNLPRHKHEATIYGAGGVGRFSSASASWRDGYPNGNGIVKRVGHGNSEIKHGGDDADWLKNYEINTNHTHQIAISDTGNGEKIKFEPSFLCLYFWVRTA